MEIELIITDDGSHTLFVPELNESFHSTYGAINESLHVFINCGLNAIDKDITLVNILEVGFGTGLNAFLTCIEVESQKKKVNYLGIEPFPLDKKIYSQLNYSQLIVNKHSESIFKKVHDVKWSVPNKITSNFTLLKSDKKLEDIELQTGKYDLVYFDAFAPDIQSELWTREIFNKIFSAMSIKGWLMTYSAKGSVKRALTDVGFKVENLTGPRGKREITRAIKNS